MTLDRQQTINRVVEAMKLKHPNGIGYVDALIEARRLGACQVDAVEIARRVCFVGFQHMNGGHHGMER